MLDFVLDLIYPTTCGYCGEIGKEALCKKCEIELNYLLKEKIDNYKNRKKYLFEYHVYLYLYKDIIRKKIIDYKFNDKSYLYETFAKNIINSKKICEFLKRDNIIIPVPIHKKRKMQRGYNQSELIAKALSNRLGLTLVCDSLYKKNNIIEQSKLNKLDRTINIKNAYGIKNIQKIEGKNILLFDDIYTTGATANECSKILIENGAKQVDILTLAKD